MVSFVNALFRIRSREEVLPVIIPFRVVILSVERDPQRVSQPAVHLFLNPYQPFGGHRSLHL